jgi:hypothetical protein
MLGERKMSKKSSLVLVAGAFGTLASKGAMAQTYTGYESQFPSAVASESRKEVRDEKAARAIAVSKESKGGRGMELSVMRLVHSMME